MSVDRKSDISRIKREALLNSKICCNFISKVSITEKINMCYFITNNMQKTSYCLIKSAVLTS